VPGTDTLATLGMTFRTSSAAVISPAPEGAAESTMGSIAHLSRPLRTVELLDRRRARSAIATDDEAPSAWNDSPRR
jgi:hypothetical protein